LDGSFPKKKNHQDQKQEFHNQYFNICIPLLISINGCSLASWSTRPLSYFQLSSPHRHPTTKNPYKHNLRRKSIHHPPKHASQHKSHPSLPLLAIQSNSNSIQEFGYIEKKIRYLVYGCTLVIQQQNTHYTLFVVMLLGAESL